MLWAERNEPDKSGDAWLAQLPTCTPVKSSWWYACHKNRNRPTPRAGRAER